MTDLPTNVAALQRMQHERLLQDADLLLISAMAIRERVAELDPDGIVPMDFEHSLAETMGAAMRACVSAHVRYSALVSFRIAQTLEEIRARDADEAG